MDEGWESRQATAECTTLHLQGDEGTRGDQDTHPDFPQQIADDVESRYPGRGRQRGVAAVCVG